MSEKTTDRTALPIRRPTFSGVTGKTLEGSEPDWSRAGHPSPPEGAPNVLLVLIDDAGFGNPSTFGGPIDTPRYTQLAEQGLRYNRFHVTALCSPTRAALLTGRNHHRVDVEVKRFTDATDAQDLNATIKTLRIAIGHLEHHGAPEPLNGSANHLIRMTGSAPRLPRLRLLRTCQSSEEV